MNGGTNQKQGATPGQVVGIVVGILAVFGSGIGIGYYTGRDSASSENAALERDLNLATNSRGAVEIMESLQKLSDASNNVFRFEKHAKDISELQNQIVTLESTIDWRVHSNGSFPPKADIG